MLFLRMLIAALLTSTLAGCASIFSLRQQVLVHTDVPGGQIQQEGNPRGRVPGVVDLYRRRQSEVRLLADGQKTIQVPLRGNYRWLDSGLGNLLLIFLGPVTAGVGFAVDWATGAMWEYPNELYGGFIHPTLAQAPPPVIESIAIAPPVAADFFRSRDAAAAIEADAKKRFSKVLPYRDTIATFTTYGFDFRQSDPSLKVAMLGELQSSHRLLSTVPEQKGGLVHVQMVDRADRLVQQYDLPLPENSERGAFRDRFKIWATQFVPNTFGVGQHLSAFTIVSPSISDPSKSLYEVRGSSRGMFSSGMSVTVTNVQARHSKNFIQPFWRLRPTADLNFANLVAENIILGQTKDLTLYKAEIGVAGEVGLRLGGTELSFSVPLVLAAQLVTIHNGVTDHEQNTNFETGSTLALSAFVSENWRLRTGVDVKLSQNSFWDRVMQSAWPGATPVTGALQVSSFFYAEYYLPHINALVF